MKKLLDADDPFFRLAWRRWATTILPLIWAGFEGWSGNLVWAILFAIAGAYAGYELLIKGPAGK